MKLTLVTVAPWGNAALHVKIVLCAPELPALITRELPIMVYGTSAKGMKVQPGHEKVFVTAPDVGNAGVPNRATTAMKPGIHRVPTCLRIDFNRTSRLRFPISETISPACCNSVAPS